LGLLELSDEEREVRARLKFHVRTMSNTEVAFPHLRQFSA
jgi:hypothetical protein